MRLVIPEFGALDALAAMEECPFDDDDHRELGHAAIVRQGAPDILIANDDGPAGDAQRFPLAGNKEDQTDAGVPQHIVESIHPPVAAAIRNRKRRVVQTSYESGVVALWREIDHAERIGRADHDEWGCCDKIPTTAIEPVENLAGEPSVGRPDNLPQFRFGCDHLVKPLIGGHRFYVHIHALLSIDRMKFPPG